MRRLLHRALLVACVISLLPVESAFAINRLTSISSSGSEVQIGGWLSPAAQVHDGIIARSFDGGASFVPTVVPDAVVDSVAGGPGFTVAAGSGDRAFTIADGGHWLEHRPLLGYDNVNVRGMATFPSGRTVAVGQVMELPEGNAAFIRTTDDRGNTWQSRYFGPYYPVANPATDPGPPLTRSEFVSVDVVPGGQAAWAVGSESTMYYTFNEDTGLGNLLQYKGVLMQHSTDGGSTWTTQTVPGNSVSPLKAVAAASDSVAFAAGMDTVFVRTMDGGATWTPAPIPGDFSIRGIENFIDVLAMDSTGPGLVVVAGLAGKVAWSTDAATAATPTWKFYNLPTRRALRGVTLLDANNWIVVGDEETILRTHDGGRTWLTGSTSSQPPVASISGPGGGFALTDAPRVISGTASDAGLGVSGVDVRIRRADGYCLDRFGSWNASETWIPAQSSDNWATWEYTWFNPRATADGNMVTVTARATDALGLTALSTSVSSGQPLAASVSLDAGAPHTTNADVVASISAPGATFMRYALDGGPYTAWMPYATSVPITLTGADGTKTVAFDFTTDAVVGTGPAIAATKSDSIVLHTSVPQVHVSAPSAGFSPGGELAVSGTASDAGGTVASMGVRIRRSDGFNWNGSAWTSTETWLLPTTANGYANWSGTWSPTGAGQALSITARVFDAYGLSAVSAPVFSAAPAASTVSLAGGDAYTTTTTVNASISSPGSPFWKYRINGGPLTPASWQSYTNNVSIALPAGDGTKSVEFSFSSDQSQVDTTAADTIVLHTTVPDVAMTSPSKDFSLIDGKVAIAGTSADEAGSVETVQVRIRRASDGKLWNGSAWQIVNEPSEAAWLPVTTADGYRTWTASWTPDAELLAAPSAVFIWARAVDQAGLVRTTGTIESGPVLSAGAMLNGGELYTTSPEVPVALDGAGATHVKYSVDGSAWTDWLDVSSVTTLALGSADGPKNVSFRFSANGSAVHGLAEDAIVLDSTLPSLMLASPVGGFDYRTGALTIGGTSHDSLSGVSDIKIRIEQGGRFWTGTEGGWQGTEQWVPADSADGFASWSYQWVPDAVSRASGQPVIVTVTAKDAAGNASTTQVRSTDPLDPSSVTLASPGSAIVAYGAKATIAGNLKVEGMPNPDGVLVLQSGTSVSALKDTAYRRTADVAGNFSFSVPLSSKTYYRVRYDSPAAHEPASSVAVVVTPKVYLSTPYASSSARRNVRFSTYGNLKPRHSSGAYAVKLYCYRYEHGKPRLRKTVSLKVKNYSSYSRYYGYLSLPYTGKWIIRAYHADSGHAASYSAFRTVYVR